MSSNASVASSTNIWSTNNNSDDSDNDFDNLNEIQEGEEKTVETKNNEEELEKKLKELQKQKSVYKKPVEDLLCSMNGLDKIYHHFPHLIKPFPVGQEGAFLKKLLSLYSEWGYQLDPKTHFNDLIIKCESVGMKGKIRGELLRLREIEKKRRIENHIKPSLLKKHQNLNTDSILTQDQDSIMTGVSIKRSKISSERNTSLTSSQVTYAEVDEASISKKRKLNDVEDDNISVLTFQEEEELRGEFEDDDDEEEKKNEYNIDNKTENINENENEDGDIPDDKTVNQIVENNYDSLLTQEQTLEQFEEEENTQKQKLNNNTDDIDTVAP